MYNFIFTDGEVVTSIAINNSNSFQLYSFICTQLNNSTYYYVSLKIQLSNLLFTQS